MNMQAPPVHRGTSPNHTVLIVDDNPTNLSIVVDCLEAAGLRTIVATDGELGLKRAKYVQPAVILLDIMMPGLDGFETCRHLKTEPATKDIPIIFMTALSDKDEKIKGFDVGGVDYITKPFQTEELLARVRTHLTIRNLQAALAGEKQRFQRLAEATFEGIVLFDAPHRKICDVNQALVAWLGYGPKDLIGRDVLDLFPDVWHDIVRQQIKNGRESACELEGLAKNGAILPMEIQIKSITWQDHTINVAALRDIAPRKAMEREQTRLTNENLTLRATIQDRFKFGEIIGKSDSMQQVYEKIVKAAASDASVLIYGESGTGKELVAKTIHQRCARKDHPFVAVNCGAVPENLFEREFFGHRKGAFTDAVIDKPGYLDHAHRGTLFLDEVSALSPPMQIKLLRVLQENKFRPLGDTHEKSADARIIAATNIDLKALVQQKRMREDFFYRIRVIVIALPPLRDRKEDIPLLIEHLLSLYGQKTAPNKLPAAIMDALCDYHWPGNVRELQNELQRYLAEQRLEFIGNDPFDGCGVDQSHHPSGTTVQSSFRQAVDAFEKQLIAKTLAQTNGQIEKTSKRLKIPRKTLYRKIRKYQLLGKGKTVAHD